MAVLEKKRIVSVLVLAALLLAESPLPIVEARSPGRQANVTWKPMPKVSAPPVRTESAPSAVWLPPNSTPSSAASRSGRQFSRGLDWQSSKGMPRPVGMPLSHDPNVLTREDLDILSPGAQGIPTPPLFQIAPAPLPTVPGTPIGTPTPVTGALPQALIPPTSSLASGINPLPTNEDANSPSYLKLPKGEQRIKFLELRDQDIRDALRVFIGMVGVNLMLANDISGIVNIQFNDISVEEAVNTLLKANNLAFSWEGNILRIFTSANVPLSTVIFSIQNANAQEVKTVIDRVVTPNRGRCDVDVRLNAVMVTDTPSVIETVRGLLPQIDVRETTIEVTSRPITEVFYLDYVDATVLSQPITMVAPTATIQAYSSSASQAGAGGGTGRMDMMIITDTPNNLSKIKELVEKLDIAPIQVTIDAHIYEIDLNEEERLGINWQKSIPVPGSTENLFDVSISPEESNAGGTGVFRFGSLNVNQFRALLAMLKTHSFAKVLSNPVITTLNNRAAQITVGQAISYISASTVNAQTGQVSNTVGQVNANITLNVTPSVTGNDEVFLNISPTISSVLGYTTLGGNSTPNLSNRTAQTQVIAKNNHTIVIGGMIKTDKSDTMSKVPFFGDLPGIGKLFQKKTQRETRTELIIFITPRILRNHGGNKNPNQMPNGKTVAPRLSLQP